MDRPLRVFPGEPLLPEQLSKRQRHDGIPCPTRSDPFGPCPVRVSTGTAEASLNLDVYPCLYTYTDDGDRWSSWLVSYLDHL
jgi:hypothetical protein